jgi:hypothetical protein
MKGFLWLLPTLATGKRKINKINGIGYTTRLMVLPFREAAKATSTALTVRDQLR